MPILTLAGAELAYGDVPLLDGTAFSMDAGERIGLIGRNGTGKTSLLGVIAGRVALDDGELKKSDGLRIAYVEQEPAPSTSANVKKYKLDEFLHRFKLDSAIDPATMSGGERKRAALALAFAQEPDLLLLDEPTNHLDVDAILTLEALITRQDSVIMITHDRAFLDRVATRIVELDRGVLRSFPGNFASYQEQKEKDLATEAVANRKFDRFWAQEEAWIRKGIEARRTRNEGRVVRLEKLREERAARRARLGQVKLAIGAGQRSGKLVSELVNVSRSFPGKDFLVKDLDLIVQRGDKLGILGPNGAGKTTLLRLILGTLAPDSGTVRLGTKVQVAYFDQMRDALDPEKTVAQTISPGSDFVELESGRKHVMSYLGDFLFPPRRAQSPVRMLSGGERNRLLLARLFARPANVLVLDEPTNDLDIESLELLEAALQDYRGTLLLVSHDRAFLDNVVTQTIAAEREGPAGAGSGKWKEYAGGYSDWLRQRPTGEKDRRPRVPLAGTQILPEVKKTKLSYKETRELAALPGEIEALEAEQQALVARMHSAEYYKQPPEILRADQQRAGEIEKLLHEKLARWTALE